MTRQCDACGALELTACRSGTPSRAPLVFARPRVDPRVESRAQDDARDERAVHRLVRRARRVSLRRGVGVGIERGRRARDEGRWKYRIALLVAREI